jgi:hypothetical protein
MSASARRAPTRAVQRRARKHKVIMETITQEKKKLRSVVRVGVWESVVYDGSSLNMQR